MKTIIKNNIEGIKLSVGFLGVGLMFVLLLNSMPLWAFVILMILFALCR